MRIKIFCLLFLAIASCKKTEKTSMAPTNSWQLYAHDLIQFKYPPAWNVQYRKFLEKHGWLLTPPEGNALSIGSVIFNNPLKADTRSLEQIFRAENWKTRDVVEKPKGLSVQGGKCIAYITSHRSRPRAYAQCLTHNHHRFELQSDLGDFEQTQLAPGRVGTRLNEEARENLRRFERILKSLELKASAKP